MTLSAHKFHGPQGVGALIMDKSEELPPLLHGGGQERGLRSGTENVAAIVGLGEAARLAQTELDQRIAQWQQLRNWLEAQLKPLPGVSIVAEAAPRLANTVMITVRGFSGETLLMGLDRSGIAVSSGSACHSSNTEPSHVLTAMGLPIDQALSAIRISFGQQTTVADLKQLVAALTQQIAGLPQVALA
jgi:cysteine desulfurase